MPAPYDPVPVLNVSGEDIPSHAVVEPTGTITDGAFEVRKPTRTGYRGVLVNGPGVIPTDKAGQAFAHPRVVAKAGSEPAAVGEEWGAVAGSWHLGDVGGGGFLFLGGYADGRANWVRYGVRDVDPSGSGSGTDTDGDGTADRRLVGYNYDVACVGGVLQKSRQPIYQFLGSGLSSYGSWEAAGTVGCCECDDDPSDGGPTMGAFPGCDAAPTTLDWTSSSGDIACLNGLTGSITKSGSVWSNGNNISPPCSSDAGFTVSCSGDVWSGTVDSGGVICAKIGETATSLTFLIISDGAGTISAGTATFVAVIP